MCEIPEWMWRLRSKGEALLLSLHKYFRHWEIFSDVLERFQQKNIYIELEVYYNSTPKNARYRDS